VDHGAFIARIVPYSQVIAESRLASDGGPLEIALPAVANALQNLSYQATASAVSSKPQFSAAVSR
jgi:hypothetical protein